MDTETYPTHQVDTLSKQRVADGAGGVGGVPPLSSLRYTPGIKPSEQGFTGANNNETANIF